MSTPTQADRVLRRLVEAGPSGVHTNELRAIFIANPSERIRELRERGHTITATREKLYGPSVGARYTLVRRAAAPDTARITTTTLPAADHSKQEIPSPTPTRSDGGVQRRAGEPIGPSATLFADTPQPGRPSAYDPYNEAAA